MGDERYTREDIQAMVNEAVARQLSALIPGAGPPGAPEAGQPGQRRLTRNQMVAQTLNTFPGGVDTGRDVMENRQAQVQAKTVEEPAKRRLKISGRIEDVSRIAPGAGLGAATPIKPEVAEAIKDTAVALSQEYVTYQELQNWLAGIPDAIKTMGFVASDPNHTYKGGKGNLYLQLPPVEGATAEWAPAEGGGKLVYDYVWVGTKKVVPPTKTSNYLKIMLDGSACSWVDAMPETQDADAVVIDVTKNRIYLHGNIL